MNDVHFLPPDLCIMARLKGQCLAAETLLSKWDDERQEAKWRESCVIYLLFHFRTHATLFLSAREYANDIRVI